MKIPIASLPALSNILLSGLVYLLWFINTLVCVVALIQFRSAVNVWWVVLGGDRYSLGLVNQVCLLIGGFAIFVYVVLLEGHYRESISRRVKTTSQRLTDLGLGILLRRFAITTAVPLGVCIASLVALEIALRILS